MASRRPLDTLRVCSVSPQSPSKRSDPGVVPLEILFIGYAASQDNSFRIWLGAKRAAIGYEG